MKTALALLVVIASCASPDTPPAIDHARPPWAPLAGGTTIEIAGASFDPDVNRVFVAGREAPIVRTRDDQHLLVVVPPGDHPGDAELVVVSARGTLVATGVFRYSAPPAIESVTPSTIVAGEQPTIVVHGSGFLDEEAGTPTVSVDHQVVAEVTVRDDATLMFPAPPGVPFTRPEIEVINERGITRAPGFRYIVSERPGVLAYSSSGGAEFAWFYEPVAQQLIPIPRHGNSRPCFYAAMTDENGEHAASTYCNSPESFAYGRVDLASQSVVDLQPTTLYYAMAIHEGVRYGIELNTRLFGTFGANGTNFTAITTQAFPGGQYGLASDRKNLWLAARDATFVTVIGTIDPETGVRGPTVPLVPQVDVLDLTWFGGVFYAPTSDGRLVTIDPVTGTVTSLGFIDTSYAIDVLEN